MSEEAGNEMNFIHPEMLYLIPVAVAAVIWFSFRGGRLRRSRLRLLLGQAAEDPQAVLLSPQKRRFRHVLLALTLVSLLLAAARPYWNSEVRPTGDSGRDVLVLFDVSKSMLATDLAPSRLEHAKFLLRQLVSADPGDSFGLVAFAGTAYLSCPLTSDRVAFEEYVKELSPDVVPIGGTNLELALRKAMDAFKAASGNNRAILLFTDGDELTGSSGKAISELKKREIPLFVVGLGDPSAGAPVLNEKGEARRDRQGHLISTRLNETALKKLALETGGVYVRASVADSSLGIIEKRIAALGRASDGEKRSRTIPVERFPLPLLAAAVFLAGFLLLGERPGTRRKMPALTLLFALFLLGAAEPGTSAAVPSAQGGEPPAAANPTQEELFQGTPEERYNRARELQLAGDAKAEKLYETLLNDSTVPPGIQSRSLFNLGTGALQSGRKAYLQAEALVQKQQLDPALKSLDRAKQALDVGEDLNMRAISIPESGAYLGDFNANLQQLTLDRARVEELRRKIEELKKQQQEAQKRTEQARQKQEQQQKDQKQNRQNKQNQQKQDQRQNKQDQQKQDQRQNKQDQQKPQQDKDPVDDALNKARQAAEKLQKQADQLGQKQLSQKAGEARDELEKAQKDPRPEPRKEHIRKAQEALGKPEPPKQNSGDKQKQDGKDSKPQGQPQAPQNKGKDPGKEEPRQAPAPKPGEKGAEQLLRAAQDEESKFREGVRRQQYRTPRVEKDW